MKKQLSAILCVILAFSLSACNEQPPTQSTGSSAPAETPANTEIVAPPTAETTANTEIAAPPAAATTTVPPQPISVQWEPDSGRGYIFTVGVGRTVLADMDGDGNQESICYSSSPGARDAKWSLTVDGVDFSSSLEKLGYYRDCPETDCYYITDIDTTDGYLEIATCDSGPSDDLRTDFLRWDGEKLVYLGNVQGFPTYTYFGIDGDGIVHSNMRFHILQTWWAFADWVPIAADEDCNARFDPLEQDVYYATYVSRVSVTANMKAYTEKDLNSDSFFVNEGAVIFLLGSDNAEWILAGNTDGTQFWIHMDNGLIETEEKPMVPLFGLNMAD